MPALGLVAQYNLDKDVWQPIERIGLFVYQDGDSVRLIPMGGETRRSGIRQGDLPVAIDGRPIADGSFLEPAVAARLAGPDGTTVRLTTLSPDGRRPGASPHAKLAACRCLLRTGRTLAFVGMRCSDLC